MTKNRGQTMRQRTISELERLSRSLDAKLEITANMSIAEINNELHEMDIDPCQLPPLSFSQMVSEKSELKSPAYVYVSDELLHGEPITDDVKLFILELRHLSRQQRYDEALELARRATVLAPDYWRAWISYGGLLVLLGNVEEGEAIFSRTKTEFSANPKAVAAALHGCACVKEIRGKLNLSKEDLLEVTSLYEKALEFDDSRANTRACLVINSLLAGQTSKSRKLLERSIHYEGFFDAMLLELEERGSREYGAKMYQVMPAFPIWFRNLLFGVGPGYKGLPMPT